MEFFVILALYILVGASCMYLILCADPHKGGPISTLHRFIFVKGPEIWKKYARKLLGERGVGFIDKSIHYVCYKNHPLVQIMYLLISIGGFYLYLAYGFWVFFPNKRLSMFHYYAGWFFWLLCLWIYYKACTTSPGKVTKDNVKQYITKYKYDGVMFTDDSKCKTCEILKPARSKHCRVCDFCVAKFDHHCVWIKQCVGEKNYKWFLSFIWGHSLLCGYGAIVAALVFYGIIIDQRLLEQEFRISSTGQVVGKGYWVVFQYLFFKYTSFFFIFVVCTVMSVTLGLFGSYHLSLIKNGTTTNEKIKRGDFNHAIKHELKKISADLDNPEVPAEKKEQLKKHRDLILRDEEILKKMFKTGLWTNLKEIFSA